MATKRTIALSILVVVLILLAALWASRHLSEGRLTYDEGRSTIPFVYIYMLPKYPLPGEDVVGGLKVAVWRDGKVVRARTVAEVGKAYIEGRLTPEQLKELVSSIEQNGILNTRPDESSPMHAANDTLKIWTLGGQRAWAHSVPNKENALVKQIEDVLMTINIPNAGTSKWESHYPHEWEK